jgi:hypothetical protein
LAAAAAAERALMAVFVVFDGNTIIVGVVPDMCATVVFIVIFIVLRLTCVLLVAVAATAAAMFLSILSAIGKKT